MKFRFNKFSIFVIVTIFLMISLFGFIMNLEQDNFYGDDADSFDSGDSAPSNSDEMLGIERTSKTLIKIPGASFSTDMLGSATLWDSWDLEVPWININFKYGNIFGDLYTGYSTISSELSSAPLIIQMVFYSIPLTLLFVILRSLEIGI